MSSIAVFGAGGRAGRRVVAEASTRGHQVTAVVRDPATCQDLAGPGVVLVAGDVTRADSVAAVALSHDAAINAATRMDVRPETFYVAAARALLEGLAQAGVGRLLLIGIGTVLRTEAGIPVHDTPGFPPEGRAFSLGHAAELAVLRAATTEIDWLVVAPPPTFLDDEAARTGRYRLGGDQVMPTDETSGLFSYADLAVAVVDEIETPKHHRTLVAVAF